MLLSVQEKSALDSMSVSLLAWYKDHGRELPWRKPSASNYEKICVEVLLQQTRAETVASYYDCFFKKYPSWLSISRSPIEELECMLKPLGLWKRRARSLKNLATNIVKRSEDFPTSKEALLEIPAVGQYVASAIMLFCHGIRAPLLDAGMARVIERNLGKRKLADIRYDPWLNAAASYLIDREECVHVNWAVLDLAAKVCKPRNPSCDTCPLSRSCGKYI